MRRLFPLLLLLFCASAARAQLDETELWRAVGRAKKPKDEPQAVAQAIDLAFSSATWTAVKLSTSGPVVELSRLAREGFYKRELITLVVTAARAKKPFQELVAKRKKGATLSEISFSCGLDYDAVYESALSIEAIVDKQYLKRFPQRAPKRGREDPF